VAAGGRNHPKKLSWNCRKKAQKGTKTKRHMSLKSAVEACRTPGAWKE
jgi:hypothetical protein